jgi:hypothetical protein
MGIVKVIMDANVYRIEEKRRMNYALLLNNADGSHVCFRAWLTQVGNDVAE